MKANELKAKNHVIKLKDGYHNIVFDMNVMAEIEEIYGSIQAGVEAFNTKPIKAIIVYMWAFLKQEVKHVNISQKYAGELIDMALLKDYIVEIQKAIEEAMPPVKEEKEESPNV